MLSLKEFVKSGQIGPAVLGASPKDVMEGLGDPTEISAKSNPLLVTYGPLSLTFAKGIHEKRPVLREIEIHFSMREPVPLTLKLSDWPETLPPRERWFLELCETSDVSVNLIGQGAVGKRFITSSGVVAVIRGAWVDALRLSAKELRSQPKMQLVEDDELTESQLTAMLGEARRAYDVHAYQAAFLVSWAALESVLRSLAIQRGLAGKTRVNPLVLVKELAVAGGLSLEEAREIENFRQMRASAAHGVASIQLNSHTVLRLLDVIGRLRPRLGARNPS